jgi:biotin synthase
MSDTCARITGTDLDRLGFAVYLAATGAKAEELHARADEARRAAVGTDVHVRGIIEFSNYCERGCFYCGLRHETDTLTRYRMSPDEIVSVAVEAREAGYRTVVLQSGEDSWFTAEIVADMVRRIKAETDLAVTLSIGERPREEYALWHDAGADRYLLKHETADRGLYRRLHPDSEYDSRQRCLRWLMELGFQTGSGCMIGLPGQTLEMLAGDLLLIRDLGVHMAGVGPFIPHPATPLGRAESGSPNLTLNAVACLRLLIPHILLPATTALETLSENGRRRALRAGANVIMPNVTPFEYRARYEIYPNKASLGRDMREAFARVTDLILSEGRTVGDDPGHSPAYTVTPSLPGRGTRGRAVPGGEIAR